MSVDLLDNKELDKSAVTLRMKMNFTYKRLREGQYTIQMQERERETCVKVRLECAYRHKLADDEIGMHTNNNG